ncbi:MAG: phosphoribosyltransferase [Candidatus Pacearchaeota archaeon]
MNNPYITPQNIAKKVIPIVKYINDFKPHYTICCDRSARIIGYSVFKLYGKMYGSFPTFDSTMRFRKISKKDSEESLKDYLRPTIEEIAMISKRPRVLIIDDWIRTGRTHENVRQMFKEIGKNSIDLRYATLLAKPGEKKIDIYCEECDESHFVKTSRFRNNPLILGVDYKGFEAIPIRSEEMRSYRNKINQSIDRLFP